MNYFKMLILLPVFISCTTSTENEEKKVYHAYGENQFVENTNLNAELGGVIVTRLEDLGAPTSDLYKDTGGSGVDVIPITVGKSGTYTFTRDSSLNCSLRIWNYSTSQYIEILTAEETSKSILLNQGSFLLQFRSTVNYIDSAKGFQNVFLYPPTGKDNIFNLQLSQYECKNSNLASIDLTNYDLQKVDLSGSDLSEATLRNIDLKDGIFVGTNFHASVLYAGRLTYANFQNVDFSNADMQYCYLSFSDVRGATFCDVLYYGWIVGGVIHDNTTQCWPISN
ncbi:MAG: pentapeptide repeat-containing protein [bacterium]